MLDKLLTYLLFFLLGIIFFNVFLTQKHETLTIIENHTDTIYVEMPKDTVFLTRERIKHVYLRDTIIEQFKPVIRLYSASYENQYGNLKISGEVLGEILTMDFKPDFRFPLVTNTITKTNTVIKKPQGLYVGSGLKVGGQSNFSVSADLIYMQDKNLFGYSYSLDRGHGVMYGRKIF